MPFAQQRFRGKHDRIPRRYGRPERASRRFWALGPARYAEAARGSGARGNARTIPAMLPEPSSIAMEKKIHHHPLANVWSTLYGTSKLPRARPGMMVLDPVGSDSVLHTYRPVLMRLAGLALRVPFVQHEQRGMRDSCSSTSALRCWSDAVRG